MQRFVAFLDILGFQRFVRQTPLDEVTRRLGLALDISRFWDCGGHIRTAGDIAHPDEQFRSVHRFSFSDSFVLATADDSQESFNTIIIATFLYARGLFTQQLAVRGAIAHGEADYVPGTEHIVGRAVLDAVDLEKQQDWFGVALSAHLGGFKEVRACLDARVAPLIVEYPIPMKGGEQLDCAINWRLNLWHSQGTKMCLPLAEASDGKAQVKRENTLRFAKHVRDRGLSQTPHDRPWLLPIIARDGLPAAGGNVELQHGDEF